MKKTKQILIRVSQEDYEKISKICEAEKSSMSELFRDLIKYKYSYLKKNNKLPVKSKQEEVCEEISPEILAEFRSLMGA